MDVDIDRCSKGISLHDSYTLITREIFIVGINIFPENAQQQEVLNSTSSWIVTFVFCDT